MNRRPSFADRIRQIREARHLEEKATLTQTIQEAEAAKAAELARLDKIVDNSSDKNRNFFIAYLGLLIYVQAIIFSTSDLKLLLPNQELKLPLIDLGVPLVGFYFTIPIFVIALHFNFLQNLESHHYKLMRWQQAHPDGTVPRSRLNPFLFDYAILEQNSGFRNWVLWANNILCYNLAPITLALLLFRYADRQDFPVTVWHYTAFVVDSYLVWRLRKALSNNKKPDISEHNRSLPAGSAGILPAEMVANMTTKEGNENPTLAQAVPEKRGSGLTRKLWDGTVTLFFLVVSAELALSYLIAGTDDDTFNRHVISWAKSLSNKNSRPIEWVLPRIKIEPTETVWQADDKALKIEAELAGESNWVKYFNEQGHGFRPDPTSLRLVDLSGQKMPLAQLSRFRLQGADLSHAQMQGADLSLAHMQEADLVDVQMQGADLSLAQMQGADLLEAQMQGANCPFAQMQGANLRKAQIQGAYLIDVWIQGAYLGDAQIQGADLTLTQMQGVILDSTSMQGAFLHNEIPVYGGYPMKLFGNTVTDWALIEKLADQIPNSLRREIYLDRIKQAQQPKQINQAQQNLHYEPRAIANSALSEICKTKYILKGILPKENYLTSAQAFRNGYIDIDERFKQNPDYPKIVLDIDYQLCTLDECKDLRNGIEGLDCQKASQNPPKW